eukprot:1579616-Rhodomonas_salina.4
MSCQLPPSSILTWTNLLSSPGAAVSTLPRAASSPYGMQGKDCSAKPLEACALALSGFACAHPTHDESSHLARCNMHLRSALCLSLPAEHLCNLYASHPTICQFFRVRRHKGSGEREGGVSGWQARKKEPLALKTPAALSSKALSIASVVRTGHTVFACV